MAASLYLSLTDYDLLTTPNWVGLDNFVAVFTRDRLFLLSLSNTAYYVALSVPSYLLVSFVLALVVNRPIRGINLYRTVYYIPSVTPTVASSIFWLMVFQP